MNRQERKIILEALNHCIEVAEFYYKKCYNDPTPDNKKREAESQAALLEIKELCERLKIK